MTTAEVDLAVHGMTCASCVARVEKKLNKIPGATAVVNLATERAHVELDDTAAHLSTDDLVDTVVKAGYDASPLSRIDTDANGHRTVTAPAAERIESSIEEARLARSADLKRRFIGSAVLLVPIMLLSMIPAWQFPGWQWVTAVLSVVVAGWAGWPFHRSAFRAARYGSTTMDTLVSLGVLAAMGWSLWALLFGGAGEIGYTMHMTAIHELGNDAHPHLYFESAAMIVTFLLIGRWLEARSRHSAGDALRALLELGAREVYVVQRADGEPVDEQRPISALQVGDIFRTRAGETVASDGVVVSGSSALDCSLVTGESVPVDVAEGAEVTGGTLATSGSLDVRATRVGDDTMLAQMGRLLADAQTGKAPVQRLADRISAVFVPAVIIIALITLVVRLALQDSFETALTCAITIVVVACPCALGLATPTALLVGSGRMSQRGVLISGPAVLEGARQVDTIVWDKTGTLTTGEMTLADVVTTGSEAAVLKLAAGLENHSQHPLARAIVRGAHDRGVAPADITDFCEYAGRGVAGQYLGVSVCAGTAAWIQEQGIDLTSLTEALSRAAEVGASTVVVAYDGRAIGVCLVTDTPRPEAAEAVQILRSHGLSSTLLTGDNAQAASAIATQLGIDDVHAQVQPADKYAVIGQLQETGHRVAMVGDGVNDAAALAAADLSIALGSGTDVAQAAADMTVVNSDIRAIPDALRVSSKTVRIIRQNVGWAFAYNLIAIPLAASGFIMPGIAAIAMAASSVVVVTNSLRLRSA